MTYPGSSPQPPRDALAGALKRTEIQHSPSSIPGREIVQVPTEIPAGVESGWHVHPGEDRLHRRRDAATGHAQRGAGQPKKRRHGFASGLAGWTPSTKSAAHSLVITTQEETP